MKRISLSLSACLLTACVSQTIAPATLEPLGDSGVEATQLLERSVEIANEFLASEHRRMLPAGTLAWRGDRLVFTHADGELALHIRRTTFGGVVESFGYEAQERSDGFVVGRRGEGDPRLMNSLFISSFTGMYKHPASIAELILHELTHTWFGDGTVGVWSTIQYYAEAIFLFRYREHSAEERPYRTSSEFETWWRATTAP